MKINYYLRGLGIGMVVTALLMGITQEKQKLTENQIIAEAKKLGMVEKGEQVLSDSMPESHTIENPLYTSPVNGQSLVSPLDSKGFIEEEKASDEKNVIISQDLPKIGTKEDEIEDGQAIKQDSSSSSTEKKTESSSTDKARSSSSSEKINDSSPAHSESGNDIVSITITSGMSSTSVSKVLADAGLVDDAAAFDRFLCENGYDRKITTGKKEIPVNASKVEIAGILTVK